MDGLARTVEGDDDGQADGDFCSGDGDDKEDEHLAAVVGQAIHRIEAGKGDECQVGGAEHQLQAHEDDNDVPAEHHTGQADGKQETGDEKVVVQGGHNLKF